MQGLHQRPIQSKNVWHQRLFVSTKKVPVIRAVAIPAAPSPAESTDYRKQLSESYGFRQIGEPLPDNVTLKDIISSLPKKVVLLYRSMSSFYTLEGFCQYLNGRAKLHDKIKYLLVHAFSITFFQSILFLVCENAPNSMFM